MTRGQTSRPTCRYHPDAEPSAKGGRLNIKYRLPFPTRSLKTEVVWLLLKVTGARKQAQSGNTAAKLKGTPFDARV